MVLRPQSRGEVLLASDDPTAAPRIRQNFLATEYDWKTLRAGLRIARDVCRQPVMAPFIDREIAPGANAVDDADFDAHIRANGITVHHPLGTCKMGVHPTAWRWSMPSCGSMASPACASSTPR